MLQPDLALVRKAVQQSARVRKTGDLRGALAVYDELPERLKEHPEACAGRERAMQALTKSVHKRAQRLRYDGQWAEALESYAVLPAALHDRPDVVQARASLHDLMRRQAEKARRKREAARKQATKEIGRLLHAGDLVGALAFVDALPPEIHESDAVRRARNDVIETFAARVNNKFDELQRAGDLVGVLAVYDALPLELRESGKICLNRITVLERLTHQAREEIRRLKASGDLAGALAVYDALPTELRESENIRRGRDAVRERLAKQAKKEGRRLRRAEDFAAALAACEALPPELRGRADILEESARSLHALGRLEDAHDRFRQALALDPTQTESWQHVGIILKDLGRSDEIEPLIRDLLSRLPPTFETLVEAARIARSAKLLQLTDDLLGRALSMRATAEGAEIVRAARTLLKHGEQGWVVSLLEHVSYPSDMRLQQQVLELRELALEQLRRAGWSTASGRLQRTERADAIAVRSILAQADRFAVGSAEPPRHGLAIVVSSLGAGGAQRQVVELVREICKMPREVVGPVVLLLISRSSPHSEFHAARLAGLDIPVEFMSDFQIDPNQVVPPEAAAQLSVLSPNNHDITLYLAARLRAHRPAAVLSMSDLLGIPTALAATIVGVPRIVVSARNVAPPLRKQTDSLLEPGYRAALAQERISLVTNCAGTARGFADWLQIPAARVGVVYNGVDIEGLIAQRDAALVASHRRALGISPSARIVGSIFQARSQKRPRLWLLAAAAIAQRAPDVVFVVVGDKLRGDEISAMLAQHGLAERFHWPGIRTDVTAWLDLMDVVLLTSAYEGTPNVLLEAQALGRPVVATDVGGCAESLLPEQTGVLVSASPTPEEVADAVLRVLDDPGFAARAAVQGPAFIRRRFEPQRMACEYVDLCFSPRSAPVPLAASA